MGSRMLIIQFPTSGAVEDLDWLVGIEDALIQGLFQNRTGTVDGHDFGNGTMNIYIRPKGSGYPVGVVKAYLKHHDALDYAVIATRSRTDKHTVIWPPDFEGSFSY